MRKRKKNLLERMSFKELGRKEKICLYLKDHPEVLTQELMDKVATRYMNIGYIRKTIKKIYSKFVLENLTNNNFIIVPDHYGKE
jgi:hypothetical protein